MRRFVASIDGLGRSCALWAILASGMVLSIPGASPLFAQADTLQAAADSVPGEQPSATPATIDTIVIQRANVFTPDEATNGFFRLMNKIHVVTYPWVIKQDIRLEVGEAYDPTLAAETQRLLLERQIFRSVSVDTARIGDQLGLFVKTQDSWTLKPKFAFSVASDGTATYTIGVNEVSLLGTGNMVYVAYDKQVDRQGLLLSADFGRILGTQIDIIGNYAGLSDGKNGNWGVGTPYRYFESKRANAYMGSAANQKVFRFISSDSGALDSVSYQHDSFINTFTTGWAPMANSRRYLRVAGELQVRAQTYVEQVDPALPVDDSIFATIGAIARYQAAKFVPVRHFNGFGQETVDLSTRADASLRFAPEAFGYLRTGIGPGLGFATAKTWKDSWAWVSLVANGVFDSSGLDSGRVVANVAMGTKFAERLATGLQIQFGHLEDTAPGSEFDLGFNNVLRSWGPHAFVGTREFWGTLEQRWYVWDSLANLIGIGFAAFVDYGGAWYEDQGSRLGGDVGVGIRIGSAISAIPRTSKLDLGYKFGDGVVGDRWAVSFGAAFVFPWRQIPVTCYRAQAPQITDCPTTY